MTTNRQNASFPAADPATAEQELRDFLENAVEAMHWVGPDGTILWANAEELRLLGYSRDEYVGRHIADFHADRTVIDDILTRLWRNETLRNCEARMRRKDGAIRDVLINSSVFWRDGEFVHTRCVTRDVTEARQAEAERRRAIRHLAAEHMVTKLLADPRPFSAILPRLLQTIGEVGDWQLGALWIVDEPAGVLRCLDFWHTAGAEVNEFEVSTRARTFTRGVGLPGRIWASGEPVWIDDVIRDTNFPRAPLAERTGVHSAIGFPIRVHQRITGVLEFFGREVRTPDDVLLELFEAVGTQIGHFIERREIDEVRDGLAAIVDSSDDAIISKTLDGTITSWNTGAEQTFGYTADEAVGRHISLIIPADRVAEEDQVLGRLRRGEKVEHFETVRQTKDGRLLNISLTVSPVRNSDGQIVGASKVARDITAQKLAEEELRRSNERARAQAEVTRVLHRAGAAVASSLDRGSIVQTVTDLATEVTTAEFGAFFYNVIDPQSGEAFLLYALSGAPREAFAGFPKPRATALFGPTFRGEGVIRLDDVTTDPRYGQSAPYHGMPPGHLPVRSYLAVPVLGRSGNVLGGLFFGHSRVGMFTEQHEQLVSGIAAWASIALDNAQLYADAERAVTSRDEFLSVASHELRNPLNALQLQLVTLHRAVRDGEDAPPHQWIRERVRQATEDVGALVRLVHNLLDVARITAGRMDVEPEDLDFGEVVRGTLRQFGQQLTDLEVTLDLPAILGRCDRLRLEQVVTNLVSNAIKYGEGKPVEIALTCDGDTVRLSVTDHGIGIAPEDQRRLFERFSRAVPRRQYGGFGLGLWIARETARALGGELSLASTPDVGSTFIVSMPRMVSGNANRPSSAADAQPPQARRAEPSERAEI